MSGLRTPSRIGKRTRYNTDAESLNAFTDNEHQEQLQHNHHNENNENEDPDSQSGETAAATAATGPSIQTELEQTKRLVNVFDAIDLSMTEARDKLKTFYKTADETNTLLDMWIRVLSQTEHSQKLLQDPAWEGQSMEEARDREYQERRAAYQQAMEEANRRHSYGVSPSINHNNLNSSLFASSTSSAAATQAHAQAQAQAHSAFGFNPSSSIHQNNMYNPSHKPLKKSPSALVAAAHAHASAIAANRKRNAAGGGSGLPRATTTATPTSIVK
ncbi:hypothetical protein BGX26_012346 [Mortierella sp. AD094]|nr:hypothetical protein BGX26_012346 [Mortierella sp. AD094]